MRMPRFYTAQLLAVGQSVVLEPAASHHLLRVLRIQIGKPVLLFNGDGHEYLAVFEANEGKLARLAVTGADQPQRESALHISLGQGISRGERMDLVIQKAVELGVNNITPLWTRRSQVRLSGKRLDKRLCHWRAIVQSACEQSGRVYLPELLTAIDLNDWLEAVPRETVRIVLDPESDTTLHEVKRSKHVQVLIGPEGGFEKQEVQTAVAGGFQRVRLGARTLRTETAALAALAALQTLWGDFGDLTGG
jgi:16S rRNA (uracil1498-N3)-methyltransferase